MEFIKNLLNNKSLWEVVFNTIEDGVLIISPKGEIVECNKAAEKITGYSREELLHKRCTILKCDSCNYARKNSSPHWCTLFKIGGFLKRHCTITKKDGAIVHILKNASLLKDSDGSIIGAVETLTDLTELVEKEHEIYCLKQELDLETDFYGMVGQSPKMKELFNFIANIATSNIPVIIYGESGTGKELVAQAIHTLSNRKSGPLIKVNCAALNPTLLESELFGHIKGAFTGAYRDRQGRFEAAKNGSIFLDEIGDIPLEVQVKLLRVLEQKTIEKVGDNRPIAIDARIICATNKNLKKLVEEGKFRQDLYFRVNIIPVYIPPLRERKEDIPLLVELFLERLAFKSYKKPKTLSPEVMNIFMNYNWPGNVRELKNCIEYAFITSPTYIITPKHLPPDILEQIQINKKIRRALHKRPKGKRDIIEKQKIIEALKKTNGNQTKAALLLGISRVTLWHKLKIYNIELNKHIKF